MPSFHNCTDKLLAIQPTISVTAVQQLDHLEAQLGLQLPCSLRQWYSKSNAIKTLMMCSNDDRPISIQQFEPEQWRGHTLLPFKIENQGVCRWAILLDGSDDPPVFVNVEEAGWIANADTFSQHVYSCVWEHTFIFSQPALVQAQHESISSSALNTLADYFTEEIRTYGWPGRTQYRFAGDLQAILIWSAESQADWFIAAEDLDALQSLLRSIWHLDGVRSWLYGCSTLGHTALETFTAERISEAT